MNWNENHIKNIVADLAEENAFACRALFKISEIVFTSEVPSLAVSLSSKPVLAINKAFLNKYARSENDIKAVLMHEFLHVILQHTEKFKRSTQLLNIALDAIINSIIHRTYGSEYSDFFCRLYRWSGITKLMRPHILDYTYLRDDLLELHHKIYSGTFAADDLYEVLKFLLIKGRIKGILKLVFVGNHDFDDDSVSPENEELLKGTISRMNGTGIWNKPGARGSNSLLNDGQARIEKLKIIRWRSSVYAIIKKCMMEDVSIKNATGESSVMIPILNNHDRRALSSVSWSGIIPFTKNTYPGKHDSETVNIYLDVSGSMSGEIDQIISLLYHFRTQIRTPLWVFSDKVDKALFKDGKLVYKTTNGTSISCVFDHIRANGFRKNLIVTDGYVESISGLVTGINLEKLWAIISAAGNAKEFEMNHIKYNQLRKY